MLTAAMLNKPLVFDLNRQHALDIFRARCLRLWLMQTASDIGVVLHRDLIAALERELQDGNQHFRSSFLC